jgi:hypothetical protein
VVTRSPDDVGGALHVRPLCDIVPAGPAGDVASIIVPAGYYDVQSTFAFVPAA